MLPTGVHSIDTLRPPDPQPPRPRTNEPVSVHVVEAEATVCFGTGFAAGVDPLVDMLDALGGPDVIVVEHGDPDHFDALPALLDRFDATVAIPGPDAAALEAVGVTPDVELGHDEVRWGIRTVHVPGHTPGNMSFLHEPTGTLVAGDTMVHRNSFAAAPGEWSGEFAPIDPSLNDDDAAARRNLRRLADREFERALLTHGLSVYADARAELDRLLEDLDRD